MYCDKCGAEIEDGMLYCPKCGRKLKKKKTVTKKSKSKKIIEICVGGGLLICIIVSVISSIPGIKYKRAENAYENGHYERAVRLYESLGDYEDSRDKLQQASVYNSYAKGVRYMETGDYDAAITSFEATDGYEDSNELIEKCSYSLGIQLLDVEDYLNAANAFKEANGYEDAEEKLWEIGDKYISLKDYDNALTVFGLMQDQTYEHYVKGKMAYDKEDYNQAYKELEKATGVYDTDTMLPEATYRYGMQKLDDKKYLAASRVFNGLGDYKDSGEMVKVCALLEAKDEMDAGKLNSAKEKLEKIPADFTYNDMNAGELLNKINSHSEWLNICGMWSLTTGKAISSQGGAYGGYTWTSDFDSGQNQLEVTCIINDDDSVTVKTLGSFMVYTNYSVISAGLTWEFHSITTQKTVNNFGSIAIDDYTTLNLSGSQITANYKKVDNTQDVYFTYTYETNVAYERKQAY